MPHFLLHLDVPIASAMPAGPSPSGSPEDIRDIVPPQPFLLGSNTFWLVLGIVSLLLAAWILWRYFLGPRMRRPVRRRSPREIAEARLLELEGQLDSSEARVFGGDVCDVLRTYIGAQYGLHPERQTSPEFLESISGSRVFPVSEHGLLSEFLESCDLLKFARHDASLDAKRRLLEQAREFIQSAGAPEAREALSSRV